MKLNNRIRIYNIIIMELNFQYQNTSFQSSSQNEQTLNNIFSFLSLDYNQSQSQCQFQSETPMTSVIIIYSDVIINIIYYMRLLIVILPLIFIYKQRIFRIFLFILSFYYILIGSLMISSSLFLNLYNYLIPIGIILIGIVFLYDFFLLLTDFIRKVIVKSIESVSNSSYNELYIVSIDTNSLTDYISLYVNGIIFKFSFLFQVINEVSNTTFYYIIYIIYFFPMLKLLLHSEIDVDNHRHFDYDYQSKYLSVWIYINLSLFVLSFIKNHGKYYYSIIYLIILLVFVNSILNFLFFSFFSIENVMYSVVFIVSLYVHYSFISKSGLKSSSIHFMKSLFSDCNVDGLYNSCFYKNVLTQSISNRIYFVDFKSNSEIEEKHNTIKNHKNIRKAYDVNDEDEFEGKAVLFENLSKKYEKSIGKSKILYKKFILDVSNREDNKKLRDLYSI